MKEPTPSAGTGIEPRDRPAAGYPSTRMRRNRRAAWSRRLTRETSLAVDDLIWPIFVIEGHRRSEPVQSMPGVERLSIDLAVKAAEEAASLGIPVIAVFPYTAPDKRSEDGREAWRPD